MTVRQYRVATDSQTKPGNFGIVSSSRLLRYVQYTHHCHVLSLLGPETDTDTYFTVP